MHEEDKPEIERRKSFRLDMEKELIDMVWTDSNQIQQSKQIECLDFSRGGLKVLCDQPIDKNTPVMVVFKSAAPNSQRLYARVLRCIETNNGEFSLGLILDNEAQP